MDDTHERPTLRLRAGVSLALAGVLLTGVALGPALRERQERAQLGEISEQSLDVHIQGLHRRLARARADLRDWGEALVNGQLSGPEARRAALELVERTPALRRIARLDDALVLRLVEPSSRRAEGLGRPLSDGPALSAVRTAVETRFAASSRAFEVPGDGPCVETWVPLQRDGHPLGLVGGTFSLNVLLDELVGAEEREHGRLEVLGDGGALVASLGLEEGRLAQGGPERTLMPYGLPLSLRLRRVPTPQGLVPTIAVFAALLTSLALLAHAVGVGRARRVARRRPARDSVADARRLVEQSAAPLAIFGRDLRCLAASRGWHANLGPSRRPAVGGRFDELVPGTRAHWLGVLERALRGAREHRAHDIVPLDDGTRQVLGWRLEPATGSDGAWLGFGMHLDAVAPVVAPEAVAEVPAEVVAPVEASVGEAPAVVADVVAAAPHDVFHPAPDEALDAVPLVASVEPPVALAAPAAPAAPAEPPAAVEPPAAAAPSPSPADFLELPPPVALEAPPGAPAIPEALPQVVLIADGDPFAREAGARLLRGAGFDVVAAADATETLEWVHQRPGEVAAVLLGLELPGNDGLETLHSLRRLSRELPVLLVCAPGQTPPPAEQRDGCTVLQRPFRAAQLERAVRLGVACRRGASRPFLPAGGASS